MGFSQSKPQGRFYTRSCIALLAAWASFSINPASADTPGVARTNGLLTVAGSAADAGGSSAGAISGGATLYFRLGHSIGMGIGASGGIAGANGVVDPAVDGGLAVFWRKPETGIIGLSGSGFYLGDFGGGDAGLFAGPYWESWDLTLGLGFEVIESEGSAFMSLAAGIYASDQVRITLGAGAGLEDAYSGSCEFECQVPTAASILSIYLSAGGGAIGGTEYFTADIGMVIHWSDGVNLKRRHREYGL